MLFMICDLACIGITIGFKPQVAYMLSDIMEYLFWNPKPVNRISKEYRL